MEGDILYVAVGKEIGDRTSTLQWALKRFKHEKCASICVFYVLAPAQIITQPNGFEAPLHSLTEHQVASSREREKQEIVAILDDCGQRCKALNIPFETIYLESESIAEGILEIIINLRIQKLVMGAAANSSYSRRVSTPMPTKADFVLHNAPNFCHIWFVWNNHLVFTRECTSQGTKKNKRIHLYKSLYSEFSPCASAGSPSSQPPSMHHGSSSCNTMPPNVIDKPYAQLQQNKKELEGSTENFHIESMKKQEVGKEASKENPKGVRFCVDSLIAVSGQVQAVQKDLIQMEAEFKGANIRLKKALDELNHASTQLTSFGSETQKWYLEAKEMEDKIASHENSRNIDKELSNNLQEKLDRIAQEHQILDFHMLSCEYSLFDLHKATNCFNPSLKVCEGGYGKIYRGLLNHTDVAVKMLHTTSLQVPLEFRLEVDILSKLRHPNVMVLLGICTNPWGLIYEYLPNGNLQDRLNCKNNTPPLPWQTRIQIAIELCSVLNFLHTRKPKSITHGDINPKNVLLDGNFVCKLSGFGSCSIIPDNEVDFQMACKTDVYYFGVTLLCLLTAGSPSGIVEKVQSSLENGDLYSILDHSAGQWPFVRVTQLAHMALRCCHVRLDDRPDLASSEVWRVLKPSIDPSRSLPDPLRLIREEQIPSYFICPILQEIMHDPHFTADGFTYEGDAIKLWFDRGHMTSPMTNLTLKTRQLTPNRALRSAVEEWLQKHRSM